MLEAVLGDGLIYDGTMPVEWSPCPLPDEAGLARLNADNQQLLSADSTLHEARVPEALKDESPALLHELQRLDYKLNVLLRLTAELAARHNCVPNPHPVRFSSSGVELQGEQTAGIGSTGLLKLYVNPSLPQPLIIPVVVSAVSHNDPAMTQLQFTGLSAVVVELIEKMIFRHHRRSIAGAKSTPARNP